MEHIDAITAVLRAIDAGQRPVLLESWTGVKYYLSPLTHAFIIAKLVHLEQVECAQPIPEWYKWGCSDTQAYKMLGNGWTVEVIKHILSYIIK